MLRLEEASVYWAILGMNDANKSGSAERNKFEESSLLMPSVIQTIPSASSESTACMLLPQSCSHMASLPGPLTHLCPISIEVSLPISLFPHMDISSAPLNIF